MKSSLRMRYFFWLVGLMGLFVLFQVIVLSIYEFMEWRGGRTVDVREEIFEVVLMLSVGLASMVVMLYVGWIVSKRMLEPIRAINETAQRIIAGDLSGRVQAEHISDELGGLAQTINQAFDHYQNAMDRVQRFSSDASHQLRTPLTAMRTTGEICLQKARTTEEYRDTIGSMLEEGQRLSTVVEKLLMLSRMESGILRRNFVAVDLGDMAREATAPYAPSWEDKKIRMIVDATPGLLVMGDRALLAQIVANLLDNAIRATPVGGEIRVDVKARSGNLLELVVSDTGPGVPESLRAKLFDQIGSHSPSGTGLGLTIVSNIVRLHHGVIELSSRAGHGATFRIMLPQFVPEAPAMQSG